MRLKLTWMYPDLMSTYGDRGNIQVLTRRAMWRDVEMVLSPHTLESDSSTLIDSDIILMGGAQDRQQKLVSDNLQKKAKTLKNCASGFLLPKFIPGRNSGWASWRLIRYSMTLKCR